MEDKEAKSIIESIMFISGQPVSLDSLRKLIEVDKYNTERLVRELISDYSVRHTGILIIEVAEGFQMVTNPACAPWVKKLLNTAIPKKLTQSSLETIAIIAYKQPIIKAEIEAIRGLNSDGVVKTLLERHLIKIIGRKEVPGRPLMYGTTTEFLQYFGLKNLSELPTLKEFSEVDLPEPSEPLPDDIEAHGMLLDEQADAAEAVASENDEVQENSESVDDEVVEEIAEVDMNEPLGEENGENEESEITEEVLDDVEIETAEAPEVIEEESSDEPEEITSELDAAEEESVPASDEQEELVAESEDKQPGVAE